MREVLSARAVVARCRRKRWHGPLHALGMLVVLLGVVLVCLLVQDPVPAEPVLYKPRISRSLLQNSIPIDLPTNETPQASNDTDLPPESDPLFPPDLFSEAELAQGAIILHVLGMIYMFVALAMVCDEFFVPSLDVIIEKLGISEDVAGATFMAAGGSAPELFTSVIGVFISFNDVGIGTIVGSAVFNILFVIAMCVLFSRTVLELTWWPLFRDVTFYSIALLMLVYFFTDSKIFWYEALSMFIIYILYCSFMKINATVEHFVKKHLNKNKVTRVCSTDQLVPNHQGAVQALHGTGPPAGAPGAMPGPGALPGPGLPGLALAGGSGVRRPSAAAPVIHSGSKFRHGLLQLMIHTIDPLHDGKVDEKATQLHAIASLKVLLDATKPQNGRVQSYRSDGGDGRPDVQSQGTEVTHIDSIASSDVASSALHHPNGDLQSDNNSLANNVSYAGPGMGRKRVGAENNGLPPSNIPPIPEDEGPESPPTTPIAQMEAEEDDENKPIDLSWPDTWRKRLTYLFVAPIIFPLWLTMPDTRTPRGKRFFVIAFFGSIIWIAIFSYLMVWWASTVGDTIGIPPPVMGLTILAAGTSVPDLITSVIVARKGFGDMAVSSSVGSNIFDVCVGLPVPWLISALVDVIKNMAHGRENPWHVLPIPVKSDGIACSVMLLFSMLMFVIISIAVSKWKMSKGLGSFMFVLYFIFVTVSLLFSYKKLICFI